MSVFKNIPVEDQTITPFKVYKSWEYTDTSANRYVALTSQSITISTAIKPNPANFTNGLIPLDFDEECDIDYGASLLNFTNKDVPAGILWHAIKHKYFNDYNGRINFSGQAQPYVKQADDLDTWDGYTFKRNTPSVLKSYEYIDHPLNPSSSCELGSVASVICIPQSKFGEEIKPNSLVIYLKNASTKATDRIWDDGNGNLVSDTFIPVPKVENRVIYLGFNSSEYENDLSKTVLCDPRYPVELEFYNVTPTASFILNSSVPIGMATYFSESYIRIDGTPSYFNPRTLDDYAVSFWFNLDDTSPGHGLNSHLISKRSLFRNYQLINPSGRATAGNIWRPNANITPYDIYVTQAGKLNAQVGDGSRLVTLVGSSISAGTTYHCVFQKTGSTYELWVNGSKDDFATANFDNITNNADIFIGCKGLDARNNNVPHAPTVGKIDEVQIFNTAFTQAEITRLGNTANLNNLYNVGKVSYKEGVIIITGIHPYLGSNRVMPANLLFSRTLYNNGLAFNGNNANENLTTVGQAESITIQWNSTLTLYENEILCRLREDEFNFTLNPSILKDSENGQLPKEFIYNDEFGPYITTVGLYNENAELLAIGKLAGPIKKRSNVDLNIIVRFDQ